LQVEQRRFIRLFILTNEISSSLQNIMEATLEAERKAAEDSSSIGRLELFKGKNGIRLLI